jgi:hypothetical protein
MDDVGVGGGGEMRRASGCGVKGKKLKRHRDTRAAGNDTGQASRRSLWCALTVRQSLTSVRLLHGIIPGVRSPHILRRLSSPPVHDRGFASTCDRSALCARGRPTEMLERIEQRREKYPTSSSRRSHPISVELARNDDAPEDAWLRG